MKASLLLFSAGAALFLGTSFFSDSNSSAGPGWIDSSEREQLIETAFEYEGIPYRFGGADPSGFDCSGYTRYVFRQHGVNLPRQTSAQYRTLKPVRVPEPGDLVFFRISGSNINHVGIYLGDFKFIHAPSTGKTVSEADIRLDYWKSRYAGARSPVR